MICSNANELKRRSSLSAVPALALTAVALLAGLGWWAGNASAGHQDAMMRERLLRQAAEIGQCINPELAGKLAFTAADKGTPAFEQLREQMIAVARASDLNTWSAAWRGDRLVFGPESYAEGHPIASPPGTVYQRPPAALLEVFKDRRPATTGPYVDEFGTWVTAYIPVLDPHNGELVMVMGTDVAAADWQARLNAARHKPMLAVFALGGALLAGFAAVRWHNRRRERNTAEFRNWIVAPAGLAMMVGLLLYGAHEYRQAADHSHQEMLRTTEQVRSEWNRQILSQVQLLRAQIDHIEHDPALLAAWLERDVSKLLALAEPGFEQLKRQYRITHSYFIAPDSTCMLRVHLPSRRGDLIDRSTMLAARRTGEDAWGAELGPLGTFTLRYVRPWKHDGSVIGYIELGMPVEHLVQQLADGMSLDLMTIIRKAHTTQEAFESGRQTFGFAGRWDAHQEFVVAHQTMAAAPKGVLRWLDAAHAPTDDHILLDARLGGRRLFCGRVHLPDAAGREVADIVVMRDVTAKLAAARSGLAMDIGLASVLFGGVLVLLWYIAGAAEGQLGALFAKLRQNEEHLSATLRSIGDAVVSTDVKGNVTDLNAVAEALTGWSVDEARGHPVTEVLRLVHSQTREVAGNPVPRVLTEGCVLGLAPHTALIARDGTERQIDDSCAPIRGADGQIAGAVLVFRDVSEEYRMREAVRESEARFRCLYVNSPDAYLLVRGGVIADCNMATEQMLRCARDKIVGQPPDAFSPELQPDGRSSAEAARERIGEAMASGRARFEWVHRRSDQTDFRVDVSLSMVTFDGERQLLVALRDITARTLAEDKLRKLSRVVEQTPASVVITDMLGRIEYVNPAFTQTTGYTFEEANGKNPRILKSGLMSEEVYAGMWRELSAGREWRGELQNRRKNGELYWELAVVSPLRDGTGRTTHYLAVKENITSRKAMEDELRSAARTDKLTGLPNRALVCDRLQQAVVRASRLKGYCFALLFLDFDRFKVINDSLGHDVGDMLLQEIAQRLRKAVRSGDSVSREARDHTTARLGGDEFVVLLDGLADPLDAVAVADRLLIALADPYELGEHRVYSTASIGIVTSNIAAESAEQVLRDADTAMYEAKLAGKARYVMFDVSMRQRVQDRMDLENALRTALEAGELFLMYQPIVSLHTGRIESFEALLRWKHPKRGLIPPDEFVPIAEECGLILPIGEWVLREACGQFARWRQRMGDAAPQSISVNLSRAQLLLQDLPRTIQRILDQTGIQPSCLHLEVTESAVAKDVETATRILNAIKATGVKLDMDDFGTGYSSMAFLHQFPIDVLKIDRSFIANIDRGRDFAALVHAVAQLAHNLNISVVAEGIETADQALILQSLECEFGQGYLFSKPIMGDDVPGFSVPPGVLPGVAAASAAS